MMVAVYKKLRNHNLTLFLHIIRNMKLALCTLHLKLRLKTVCIRKLLRHLHRSAGSCSGHLEETDSPDSLKVSGRGELHLSVLIENMRREGYEFAVSKAEVLYHYDENGKKLEPMELAYVDVPDEFTGAVISKLQQRIPYALFWLSGISGTF